MDEHDAAHTAENAEHHHGKGPGGTIPDNPKGIGLGASDDANTFEPEEDQDATD